MTLLRSGSASDTGLVRSSNQDLALVTATLFVVADGMGGHAGGEVASRLAVDALEVAFGRTPTGSGLSEAVSTANHVVWQHSQENPDLRGMGTTLTAAALVNEGGRDVLALVNVGDSRSYRFHNGELSQITVDHSLAEEMMLNGELTPAEAAVHPHRHILTRALGVSPEVDVDLWRILPGRGDRYVLCSDGLTNELDDGQISEVLSTVPDPQQAADRMVKEARAHGGSDNITVVIVDVMIGEDDSGSIPAVAAVSADFLPVTTPGAAAASSKTAPPGQSGVTEDGGVAAQSPKPIPAEPAPNRRERRRAKRRERRRARSRRLVTVRTFVFVILVGGVLAAAYGAVRWYDTNSYFVGLNGNELVIYQGRIGGFLWYHPMPVQRTGVTTADVSAVYLPALQSGVEESSVLAAHTYVKNLLAAKQSTSTPPSTTTPSTTTPSTTTPSTTGAALSGGAPRPGVAA